MRPRLLVPALVLALALTGCSSDEEGEGTLAQPEATATSEAAESQECSEAPPTAEPAADASADLGSKPEITVPDAPPPCGLVISDIVVGDGPEATAGSQVSVQYVGVDYETGEQFDASWDRGGEPFTFTLGAGQVIQGWDEGVAGMKVGGRRQLVIPPDLAYGEQGAGGAIGPGATLVFVVDLLEVGAAG